VNIDKDLNQIIKDIVKALSIFVTQTFSVVTFYQILLSSYFSDDPYRHIVVIFAIFFTIVFICKILLHINELVLRIKALKEVPRENEPIETSCDKQD